MRSFVRWLWVLSGIPVGVALILLPPSARLVCFTLFVLLETGHSLSPIVLAWSNAGFRRLMLDQPRKYLWLPIALFALVFGVGIATSFGWTSFTPGYHQIWHLTDWTNPLPAIVWIYWAWNIYHFGMQHFGIMRLCNLSTGARYLDMALCLGVTAFGMAALPILTHSQWVFFLMFGVFSANHWIVDIGLSSRVSNHPWLFIASVLLAGAIGFLWMIPTSHGMMIRVVPTIIAGRLGLGFVHFLYSRWLWQLGNPVVRATIGKNLCPV